MDNDDLKIWYEQPAERWPDALPVGNGRLAAMVYGGARTELIALDESTFWSGEPSLKNVPPGAPAVVAEIRRLLFAGEIAAANELISAINGRKLNYGTHLPFANLRFFFAHHDDEVLDRVKKYRRELDLDTALVSVSYMADDVTYSREVFASTPDQVVVVRLTCDKAKGLSLRVGLDGGEQPYHARGEGTDTLLLDCQAYEAMHSDNHTGVTGHARLRVLTDDGALSVYGAQILVEGATGVTLLLACGTTFDNNDPVRACRAQIEAAAARPYEQIRAAHIADHRRLFQRVALNLGPAPHPDWPADRRIAAAREGAADPALCALLFQFGRYMLIGSSRPASPLPAHLTGIWNQNVACRIAWTCDCHLDINTQMNYWIAELTNLSECAQPLFDWVESRVAPSGRHTARKMYDCPGWVAHIFSNAWGYTAPGWGSWWGHFLTGGAWVATHLWDHYTFTGDRNFLAGHAYPLLKEAAEFFLAYLVEHPTQGVLVSGPSESAETGYLWNGQAYAISMGSTVDRVLIHELLSECIAAARILGIDDELQGQWQAARAKLPPFQVGKHGQLQEWLEDYDESQPDHRHTSHLLGLFPFAQITPSETPELARAARISVERRLHALPGGFEEGGWARNNITLFYARLGDGAAAYDSLTTLFRVESENSLMMGTRLAPRDAYEMDYNTGASAGIAEMLLQSHACLALLPALPPVWSNGQVKGLCARGGFEVDLAWQNGQLQQAQIRSKLAGACRVQAGVKVRVVSNGQAIPLTQVDPRTIEFPAVAGAEYQLKLF